MFRKIALFYFFYFSAMGIYTIFIPSVLLERLYSPAQIGFFYSVAPLVRFILPFWLRKIGINNQLFFIACFVLVFSGAVFYFLLEYYFALVILNIFLGAAMGLILPYLDNYALEFLQKKSYGKARLFGSVGFIAISIILPYIKYEFADFWLFFICLFLASAFGLFIVKKNAFFIKEQRLDQGEISMARHAAFWISIFLMQVSFGGYYNFFTIYEQSVGISMNIISYFWSFGVICEILFFYFQGHLLARFSHDLLYKLAFFSAVVRWMILYLFPNNIALSFVSQSLHGLSFALLHTLSFSYLMILYKNRALASQFYYGVSFGLGGFVGALLAGVSFGPYLFLVSSFVAFIAFFYSLKLSAL